MKINVELSALDEVQKSQQAVLDDMTSQRYERQAIIESLSSQIDTDEKQLAELQNNRKHLETLLEKLINVLADIPADLGKRLGPGDLKGKNADTGKRPGQARLWSTQDSGFTLAGLDDRCGQWQ